jgi:hypothetical protein
LKGPVTKLSASRVKTAQLCSWLYWAQYILKIPDLQNDGASRGTICHEIAELLSHSKHRKTYDEIILANNVYSNKAVKKLILFHAKRLGVFSEEHISMMNDMILVALNYDFFGINEFGAPDEVLTEYAFDYIVVDQGKRYALKGFIDKAFIYEKIKTILIRDYKTSKARFTGHDIDDNLQDFIYKLAMRKEFPGYRLIMEFEFLRFPKKPIIRTRENSNIELDGMEYVLTDIQNTLDSYSLDWAKSSCARSKGFPKDKSFGGILKCGKPFKKDGSKAYECPFKNSFYYYELYSKEGKLLKVAREEDLEKVIPNIDEKLIRKWYQGCPAWN